MRRRLRANRPASLSERGCRRRVHDPPNAGRRRGANDVARAPHVDREQWRSIAETERIDAGGVVDDLTAARCGRERLRVEDIAADGLRAERAKRARGVVGPGQGLDLAPVGDEALDDRATEEPGAASDQSRVAQLDPSDNADPKRARYSTAESTVIAAATSMAHSSRSSGPSGSS